MEFLCRSVPIGGMQVQVFTEDGNARKSLRCFPKFSNLMEIVSILQFVSLTIRDSDLGVVSGQGRHLSTRLRR